MNKLLSCPFCGGKVEIYNDEQNEWYVGCTNPHCKCDAYLPIAKTEEEAINAWNTRKPMEKIKEQIEVRKMVHSEKNECDAELDSYVSCAFDEAIEIVEKGIME